MTTTLLEASAPEPDPLGEAVSALTVAARREVAVGAGTEGAHREPADFGETVCRVLAAVAANVGGIDALLARSTSWESDHVRRMIHSVVGEDEGELLRYRTEPVNLHLDVQGVFDDFGLGALYREAAEELNHREAAADAALFDAVTTTEERIRMDEIRAAVSHGRQQEDSAWEEPTAGLLLETQNIIAAVTHRAEEENNPLAADLASAEDALETLEGLWVQDQKAYLEAYAAAIRQAITARGLTITVEVGEGMPADVHEANLISDELHAYARRVTPLPMTGEAPDLSEGKPAEAVRRAGLSYSARVQARQ